MVNHDLVAKALAGADDLADGSVCGCKNRLTGRCDDIQSVMPYADLVERVYLVTHRRACLGKRELLHRLVHRRHHETAVHDHLHDPCKVSLDGRSRHLDLIQLSCRIAHYVRIRYRVHSHQEIDRRQRVHARSGRMEYLLVYTVILEPESFYDICKQFFLAFKLGKLTGIHPVFLLQPLLGIRAEHKSEDDVIHDSKGHGHDEEHQHLADHRPCRFPCLPEPEAVLIVLVLTHDLRFSLLLWDGWRVMFLEASAVFCTITAYSSGVIERS